MLIELATKAGLLPKKVSSTGGGEFHSACPSCGGHDRFIIWSRTGRYWCRRCEIAGDGIRFCRDFLGMTFKEAVDQVGEPSINRGMFFKPDRIETMRVPSYSWQEKAEEFSESCHQRLIVDSEAMSFMKSKYGLTLETLQFRRVGWNPEKRYQKRNEWGLDDPKKKICLPRGPVISDVIEGKVSKLKIRDLDWVEGDPYGKYRQIPGSADRASVIGFRVNQIAVVVESEFDAMLLVQEIGEFCTCVALGGATKKPDPETVRWLQGRSLILYSLDCDEAGQEQYEYWRSTFPNLRAWQAETRKSPADSFVFDRVDLKSWFNAGVQFWEEG